MLVITSVWGGLFAWGSYHFQKARRHSDGFQFTKAYHALQRCLAVRPQDYRVNLLAARVCRAQGDFFEAEQHLAVCSRTEGMTEDVVLEWTLLRAQSGEFPEMELQLRKWLHDGHARSSLILESMISCFFKEARYRTARVYLDKWLKQYPANSMALFWRGLSHEKTRAWQEARRDYGRSLELDPERWEARLQLATLLFLRLKASAEARNHLRILERAVPDSPDVWLLQGIDLGQQNRSEEADEYLAKVLAAVPRHAVALHQRGLLRLQQGRFRDAEQLLRLAIEYQPDMASARYCLYQCLQNQAGREKEAFSELAAYKDSLETTQRLDRLLVEMDKHPGKVEVLVNAAELTLKQKQGSLAREFLRRALQIQPDNDRVRNLLANCSGNWPYLLSPYPH